jgi:hypothetical protein
MASEYIRYPAAGGSGGGVTSLNTLTGDITLAAGSGISLVPSGNTITISSGGGFTPGSVIFAGSSGTLTQDNSEFFWDDTNHRLGIGTATPAAPLDIEASVTATSGINDALKSHYEVSPAGNSSATYQNYDGVLATANPSSNNIYFIRGSYNEVDHNGQGTVTYATAIGGSVYNNFGGTVSNAFGAYLGVYNDNGSTITNGYGCFIDTPNDGGSGTISNWYGLYVHGDSYATNSYAIYSTGGVNYFGGNVSIGAATAPTVPLEIAGPDTGYELFLTPKTGWASGKSVGITFGDTSGNSGLLVPYSSNAVWSTFFGIDFTVGGSNIPLTVGTGNTTDVALGGNINPTSLSGATMVVKGSGKVGIGNTNPDAPLSFSATIGDKIYVYDGGIGGSYGFGIQPNLFQIFTDSSGSDIEFGYGGGSSTFVSNVVFKGNGDVGIGTASPASLFSVGSSSQFQVDSSGDVSTTGTLSTQAGLEVQSTGSNKKLGQATLIGGTMTVSNTSVTANSRIFLSVSTAGGVQGFLSYSKSVGASFTIQSTSAADTSTVDWFIVESF